MARVLHRRPGRCAASWSSPWAAPAPRTPLCARRVVSGLTVEVWVVPAVNTVLGARQPERGGELRWARKRLPSLGRP